MEKFKILSSSFVTSVANVERINEFNLKEIAIAGRSNVGKSSLINLLCNKKALAKVSSECGKTRMLNYFLINNGEFHLVDLPGYGYAKVSDKEKAKWAKLIETYLTDSKNLEHVFLLVDIRHEPKENDKKLIDFLVYHNISFTIITTKADKLSKSQRIKRKQEIAKSFSMGVDDIIITSTLKKIGVSDVYNRIGEILNNESICDQ